MPKNIYLISDTHFSHNNIIKYCNRPFYNIDEMDEYMTKNWNSVVGKNDFVYHLGDVYFRGNRPGDDSYFEKLLSSLNGTKELILGNHDKGKDVLLNRYFNKIHCLKKLPEFNIILSHVPLHECSIPEGYINVHGHIHNNYTIFDDQYYNVSVELHNYSPVNIEIFNGKISLSDIFGVE